MPVKALPVEVLLQVFEELTRRELQTCSVISKNWQSPAMQIYYKELNLNGLNTYKIK